MSLSASFISIKLKSNIKNPHVKVDDLIAPVTEYKAKEEKVYKTMHDVIIIQLQKTKLC